MNTKKNNMYKFESQTKEILNLVINSLYSNKDIFLRELISNASDAIDKARFISISNKNIMVNEWNIIIDIDKNNKFIKIIDNGIGMNKIEVIDNIGTIACSGTKSFFNTISNDLKEKTNNNHAVDLIGKFGVGFYSVFMVADKVILETKKAGIKENAVRWSSDGISEYRIENIKKEAQGTEIIIYLKDEFKHYLDEWKIKEIIKLYSNFIEYPIKIKNKTIKEKDKDSKDEFEIINSQKALWLRNPNNIKNEEYISFFNHISHSEIKPQKYIHYSVEGLTTFTALLYIPSKNINKNLINSLNRSLHLYANKVFISDNCEQLIPRYLQFICGIVDSKDLPLNISRETLQNNIIISKIRKNIIRKILSILQKMKDQNILEYILFFKEFGPYIKDGVYSDIENKNLLIDLLLYKSIKDDNQGLISLDNYVNNMPSNQIEIYYFATEDKNINYCSPQLEIFKAKNYDVLLMVDPMDEFVILSIGSYKNKKFRSIGKGEFNFDIDKNDQKIEKNINEDDNKFFNFVCNILKDNIKKVRFSGRLLNSVCCIVDDTEGYSGNMEKVMKMMNQSVPKSKKIFELNNHHIIITLIKKLFDVNPDNIQIINLVKLLYNYALIVNGDQLQNSIEFIDYLAELISFKLQDEINNIEIKDKNKEISSKNNERK